MFPRYKTHKFFLALSVLLIIGTVALTPSAGMVYPVLGERSSSSVQFQDEESVWSEPVNISRSGAASQPQLVASPGGELQAFWWDRFDGLTTSIFDGQSWSQPLPAPIRSETLTGTPLIISDPFGWVHTFWMEPNLTGGSALMHSKLPFGITEWSFPEMLAEDALTFDVKISGSGHISLAYIRLAQSIETPAGVYMRKNNGGDSSWASAQLVYASIYYRLLTLEKAFVNIVRTSNPDTGSEVFYLAWNEPVEGQSLFSASMDGGSTWLEPVPVNLTTDNSSRIRLVALPGDQSALRIWEAVGSEGCTIFQQTKETGMIPTEDDISQALLNWSTPQEAQKGLSACPRGDRLWSLSNGILWVWGEGSGDLSLVSMNLGTGQWSLPLGLNFNFINNVTQESVGLGDLHATLFSDRLGVIGADQSTNDVWVTLTQVSALAIAYAPPPRWSNPVEIASSPVEIQYPVIVTDASQRVHVLWSQPGSHAISGSRASIYHASLDQDRWSRPVIVLRPADGTADQLTASLHLDGRLLLVWRGGQPSQIYFSWANTSEANRSQEWSSPVALPSPGSGSSLPYIFSDSSGTIFVAYTIPLNEGRGIYLTQSADNGKSWSEPFQIFDGFTAGWEIVGGPRIALTGDGHMHLLWERFTLPVGGQPVGLYYSQSADGGKSWSEPEIVTEKPVLWGQLVSPGDNDLHRVWVESGSGYQVLKTQVSQDSGVTWISGESISIFGERDLPMELAVDTVGQLHFLWSSQMNTDRWVLQHKLWDGGRWIDEEGLDINTGRDVYIGGIHTTISSQGDLAVVYSIQPWSKKTDSYQEYIYFTRRSLELPAIQSPGQLAPETDPGVTLEVIATPTLTPTLTPQIDNTLPSEPLPRGGRPQGNNWTGLVLGTGLAAMIAMIAFGFRLRFIRGGRG